MRLEDIDLDIIYDFIENGNPDNADPGIVEYLEVLDKVRGMRLRFAHFPSKDHIIKHLMKVDGFSRYLATKFYNDATEYFYSDTKISKDAYRNMYAEDLEKDIALARHLAKDVNDLAKISKMRMDLAQLRQLDKEDKEELPEEWFAKPWKLYAMDAEMLGLPNVDRNRLAAQIDALPELSEKHREMLKREAGVLPIKIFLDEQEDARKS
ncbi:hypothetical protein [Maribacter flavus]|uniref:Uncharacterized protein n=1 Tax=Maribacter flavus TaxID=1658664 RepID=A0A5B2TUP2_9FLAO|nr:hypothetical protein [Maribacter flavus]KAA2218256.1 hypothetical protein F0361_01150 [Maribacter flavus]